MFASCLHHRFIGKEKTKKRRTSNKMNAKLCRQILMFKGVLKGLLLTDKRELHKRY
jgi:hypothetical protein